MSFLGRIFKKNIITKPQGKSVCIFCSGDDKAPEEYKQTAFLLGQELARHGFILITGGGNNGLMNYVNNGHAEISDDVNRFGVIPNIMKHLNVHHPFIAKNNLIWAKDVHSRIKTFYKLCDDIVVLPGGFGTLHELMDCLVLSQFGVIKKFIYLINIDNFWDPLLNQFKQMVSKQLLQQKHLDHLHIVTSIAELISQLNSERQFNLAQGFGDGHWKQK
jgi:uncharacterized protein (TIGR00730 family)